MKEAEYIIGIYNQLIVDLENPDSLGYYFVYLLDQSGVIEIDENTVIHNGKKVIGPFQGLDELNQFAFSLCEKFNAEKIMLFSVAEYNSLLEKNQEAQNFHRDLLDKGNVLLNIDRKKKGIISRLFS
jgi:hypothetical protein